VLPQLSPAGGRIAWLVTDGDPRVGTAGAWYARVDRVDPVHVLENLEITDLAWSRTDRGLLLAGWDAETGEGSLRRPCSGTVTSASGPRHTYFHFPVGRVALPPPAPGIFRHQDLFDEHVQLVQINVGQDQ